MTKSFKFVLIFMIISLICSGCSEEPSNRVKKKILAYYEIGNVKDYKPISFSKFDTTFTSEHTEMIKGTVIHELSARSPNGKIKNYTHEFAVTIFPDQIIAVRVDGTVY